MMQGRRLAVLLCVCLLWTTVVHAAPMTLVRNARTVAGNFLQMIDDDGLPGRSNVSLPYPMCASYNASTDVVLVGSATRFRTLNTTDGYLGTWSSVVLDKAACACVTVTSEDGTQRAVFYVECTNDATAGARLMRVDAAAGTGVDTQATFVDVSGALRAVTYYGNALYVLDDRLQLFRCTVSRGSVSTFAVSPQCTRLLQVVDSGGGGGGGGGGAASASAVSGIAVSPSYIVVAASGQTYCYFLANNTLAGQQTTLPLIDVHYDAVARVFVGASAMAVYALQVSATTTSSAPAVDMTVTRLAGSETASGVCNILNASTNRNGDGDTITFCGVRRLYALSLDTMYMTITSASIVRALTLPPVRVNVTVARPPWPVGFVDEAFVLPRLYGTATDELNALLNISTTTTTSEQQVRLNTSGVRVVDVDDVDNTTTTSTDLWRTRVPVLVPQRSFDDATTASTIAAFAFPRARQIVDEYYNLTDVAVYGDRNVLPLCNRTRMRALEVATAAWARDTVAYPRIYTSTLEVLPASGGGTTIDNANVTRTKLLLPVPLGVATESYDAGSGVIAVSGRNATTDGLLAAANYSDFVVRTLRASYDANHTYNITFHGEQVSFDALSPAQLQELRWRVYDVAVARLRWCEAQTGGGGGGGNNNNNNNNNNDNSDTSSSSSSDSVPGCTPRVGITNVTRVLLLGTAYPDFVFGLFVPESLSYNFSLARCLDGADYASVIAWVRNETTPPSRPPRGCDTGCIVGVAVAAAVVAALLVVVAVVLLSKRRRLAVVLAPAAPPYTVKPHALTSTALIKEPEFASTVDTDEASQNPLRGPWP